MSMTAEQKTMTLLQAIYQIPFFACVVSSSIVFFNIGGFIEHLLRIVATFYNKSIYPKSKFQLDIIMQKSARKALRFVSA